MNCTGSFDEAYDCTVITANMLVYTDGNETYDDVLLPVVKEYMDNGQLNDVHPAIVNTTFVNQTEDSGDGSSTSSSGGIQNPAWFALLGVGIVAIVVGYVVWKKKKGNAAVDSEQAEATSKSTVSKGVPPTSTKEQAAYTPAVQHSSSIHESISQDITFEVDSEEDGEYEC